MGNQPNKKYTNKEKFLSSFESQYRLIKDYEDLRFSEISLYKHKVDQDFLFIKHRWMKTEAEYKEYLKLLADRSKFVHRNLLKMILYRDSEEDNLCGDFNKTTIYYEFFNHDLEKEIEQRRPEQNSFKESELWYLLFSLVSAGNYFQLHKVFHGDLRPSHVFLTPDGFVKIADHGILHDKRIAYNKALAGTDRPYLSPQQMSSLQKKEPFPRGDPFKNDVFSLGILMIEAATLEPSEFLYNWSRCHVNYLDANKLLQRIRQKYSEFLTNIIAEMINEDENIRPSFYELNEIMSPYEENIKEMKSFVMGPQGVTVVGRPSLNLRPSSPIREPIITANSPRRLSWNQQQIASGSPRRLSPINSQLIQQAVPNFGGNISPRSLSPLRIPPNNIVNPIPGNLISVPSQPLQSSPLNVAVSGFVLKSAPGHQIIHTGTQLGSPSGRVRDNAPRRQEPVKNDPSPIRSHHSPFGRASKDAVEQILNPNKQHILPASPLVRNYQVASGVHYSPGMILPSAGNHSMTPLSEVQSYYLPSTSGQHSPIRSHFLNGQVGMPSPVLSSNAVYSNADQRYQRVPFHGHSQSSHQLENLGKHELTQAQMALLEIDKRVNEALRNSSETIKKHSGTLQNSNNKSGYSGEK